VDVFVIGDVVSPILVGRRHHRVDPDAVYSEPLEMIEALDYPSQISDAVAVRVGE
jgi:hypothetical protein